MADTFAVASTVTTQALAAGGTVVFAYPSGAMRSNVTQGGEVLSVPALQAIIKQAPSKFTVAYGANGVTVTYVSGTTIPVGSLLNLQMNKKALVLESVARAAAQGPTFFAIGDSNVDQNSRWILPDQASPSSAWFSDGFIGEFRSQSMQRINFPLANEKGVSGYKLADVRINLLPQVFTAKEYPRFCMVWCGSNNITAVDGDGGSYQEMIDEIELIVKDLTNNGVSPVLYPIPPRAGAVLTTAQIHKQNRYNNYLRWRAATTENIIFIDYLKYLIDITSTTGVPLALMVKADNLHLANTGAFWTGKATLEGMDRYLPPAILSFTSAMDYYDATNNPTGSLLRSGSTNYSLMAGTTGTHTPSTGFTSSGNLATGFTSVKSGGTATVAATCSKVARSDGWASGEAQVVQLAISAAGGTDEIHNLRATPAIADVAEGDWYYAECKLKITAAPVNINAIELYLLETRPSNSQTAIDGAYNSTVSLQLPGQTITRLLRTPPIKRTADATALQVNLRTRMNTVPGTGGVTYEVMDYAVRKVGNSFA